MINFKSWTNELFFVVEEKKTKLSGEADYFEPWRFYL